MNATNATKVHVRSVWAGDVDYEFSLIRALVGRYPFVAMDTEFPGVVFQPKTSARCLSSEKRYALLKMNVHSLPLIQVGLTLSDANGRLPDLGTNGVAYFVWEFNFHDFDLRYHVHNCDSIKLLQKQGIDFQALRMYGIDSRYFGRHLLYSGLLYNPSVTWITFHSASDFAYIMKTITRLKLPAQTNDFLLILNHLFGRHIYDMKYMIRFCDGLHGGLESVAAQLQVERTVGRVHQAGSDSLLMLQVFRKLKQVYFSASNIKKHLGVIYDLESDATARPTPATAAAAAEVEDTSEVVFCGTTHRAAIENYFARQLPQFPILSFPFPYM